MPLSELLSKSLEGIMHATQVKGVQGQAAAEAAAAAPNSQLYQLGECSIKRPFFW